MIPRYIIHIDQSNRDGHWEGELFTARVDGSTKELIAEVTGPNCLGVLSSLVDCVSEEQPDG